MSATLLDLKKDGPCLMCGGELDTGWECNECGADNIDWYYPNRPKEGPVLDQCKAGNWIEVNGPCAFCGAKPGDKCGGL